MYVETSYIKSLIQQGEHQQLDFKFEIADSRKIARTLVAFANTDGGKLLVGVKDNGAIAGVRSDEEYYMVEAAASMYCKPELPVEMKRWAVDGKSVLEVTVDQKEDGPYLAQTKDGRWRAYIRSKDQTLLANTVLYKVLKNKQQQSGVLVEYTKNEKLLLNYLEENKWITQSRFCKIAGVSWKHAEKILVNLLSLQIIELVFAENRVYYQLSEKEHGFC